MGRRAVPELQDSQTTTEEEAEAIPVFGSEDESNRRFEEGTRPEKYAVQELPSALSQSPVTAPMPHVPVRAKAVVAPKPRRYRVVGLERGGQMYIDKAGRTARMVPNKILDERYFDIPFLMAQGFNLSEVADDVKQIGRVI